MSLISVSFLILKHINGLELLLDVLDSLFIVNCKERNTLSRELDNLTTLKTLIILGCEALVSLPGGLGKLSSLENWGL